MKNESPPQNPIFYNERRMRAGWRVLFFSLFLTVLFLMGSVFITPPSPDQTLTTEILLQSTTLELVAVVLATLFFVFSVDRRPWATVGLGIGGASLKELVMGIVMGSLVLSLVFALLVWSGTVEIMQTHVEALFSVQFVLSLLMFAVVAVAEELILRGYLFQTLLEGIGVYPTLALTSILFGVLHTINPNATTMGLVNVALAGLLLAIAYLKTKALWLPIGFHFAWNALQGHLYSLPVSGIAVEPRSLELKIIGPEELSGGMFGLEGSLITTIVLALASIALWMIPWIKPSETLHALWNQYLQPAPRGGEMP